MAEKDFIQRVRDKFSILREKWYQYMVSHFEEMFNGDTIKHFMIRDEDNYDNGSEEVMEEHGEDIHKELYKWIRQEYNNGNLFLQSNWRPFHDKMNYNIMYLGYRRMFIYKNYYFQFIFDNTCNIDWGYCNYCKKTRRAYHFEIALYATKNEDGTFSTYNFTSDIKDNLFPEKYWELPY